jgi:hypothetical protein
MHGFTPPVRSMLNEPSLAVVPVPVMPFEQIAVTVAPCIAKPVAAEPLMVVVGVEDEDEPPTPQAVRIKIVESEKIRPSKFIKPPKLKKTLKMITIDSQFVY